MQRFACFGVFEKKISLPNYENVEKSKILSRLSHPSEHSTDYEVQWALASFLTDSLLEPWSNAVLCHVGRPE